MSMKKKKTEEEYSPNRLELKSSPSMKDKKLSEEFIMRVLSEQEKCKRHMTQESILSLLNDYKKIVEYYSSKQDTIALYFTQKMQNLISCQAALETLDKTQEASTMSFAEEIASQPINISEFKEVTWTPSRYDIESKRKERSKKVQITLEVKKTHKRSNAKNILNKYYDECVENNQLVVNEINLQKKDLEDRLRAIHQNSLKLPIDQKVTLEVYIG